MVTLSTLKATHYGITEHTISNAMWSGVQLVHTEHTNNTVWSIVQFVHTAHTNNTVWSIVRLVHSAHTNSNTVWSPV